MKKMVAAALIVSMLVMLCGVFSAAASVTQIQFTYTPPAAGTATGELIDVGNENIDSFLVNSYLNYATDTINILNACADAAGFLSIAYGDETVEVLEGNAKYIALFTMIYKSADIATNCILSESSGLETGFICKDDPDASGTALYGYVVFTAAGNATSPDPSEPSTPSNPTDPTDPDSSNTPTTNPSVSPSDPEQDTEYAHSVEVNYVKGEQSPVVHKVDITWGSMEFTYTAAAKGTWNPETHNFDNPGVSGQWSCQGNANAITVTNHSNAAITATFQFVPTTGFNLSGTFASSTGSPLANNAVTLPSAENTLLQNAPQQTALLKLSGNIDNVLTEKTTCGTVTVVID